MYYVSKENKRTMQYFTYRGKFVEHTTMIRGIQHAIISRDGNLNVFDKYWKVDALLPLTSEDGVATVFEIDFSEFANHVVVENI